jgi:hypothetical protein
MCKILPDSTEKDRKDTPERAFKNIAWGLFYGTEGVLYLAYNTRANILFAVCKLAKACICPGETDFHALIWLIGYLQRRPYYAIKLYPDTTSNPVYNICRQHRIPTPAGKIAQTLLAALPSDI